MSRLTIFVYGVVAYAIGMGTLLYGAGFLGNFMVSRSIDGPAQGSLATALLVNTLLMALFAVQHSVMARPGFKRWWTQYVHPAAERSTYVVFSSVALGLVFWLWQPMGVSIWNVQDPAGRAALYALYGCGWLLLVASTFLINHFDLFGLRQVWLHLRGREYTMLRFATPSLYRVVRHPLYVGWLLVVWATPAMTLAHLFFALVSTVYILVAIRFEERDLEDAHGPAYAEYRSRVPMLLPFARGRNAAGEDVTTGSGAAA
jgi:protein-S-isoprenylcysteine O-methyltransferase Ste14